MEVRMFCGWSDFKKKNPKHIYFSTYALTLRLLPPTS